jgi:hypothetical protein
VQVFTKSPSRINKTLDTGPSEVWLRRAGKQSHSGIRRPDLRRLAASLGAGQAPVQGSEREAGLATLCHSRCRCLLGWNILSQICLCHEATPFAKPSVRNPG